MRFGGAAWEIRRGKVQDALKDSVRRPPMRLIQGSAAWNSGLAQDASAASRRRCSEARSA
jgi:hypothetical protein